MVPGLTAIRPGTQHTSETLWKKKRMLIEGNAPEQVQTDARDVVTFFVAGVPAPQGSKTGYVRGKRAVLVDANAGKLKPWRDRVAIAADRGVTFDEPVIVDLLFIMPRPQRPRWSVPATKPDIDKLVRAVLDGLKDGDLLADDSRVYKLSVEEVYASEGHAEGVIVTVATRGTDIGGEA